MIKTVSFAPPRASGSRSSVKATGAQSAPAEALRPENVRPASGRTTSKTAKTPVQTSLELMFDAPEPPSAPAAIAAPVKPEAKAEIKAAPLAKTAKKAPEMPVSSPVVQIAPESAPVVKKTANTGEIKAKRPRVPKDLAAQYGEKAVERVVAAPVEAEIVKKRLNKVERQARRDLIKPSDDLMARLARLNQIGARKPKGEPRGKGWKFQCGRCGTTSYFETPGGLCVCGTIAVKE